LKGQLLHARELSFTHPTTGAPLTFTAPLPPHFTAILDKIECERIQ
jgi:23S rRNA pseudouridine1911/1915/1917 synthase